MRRVMAIVLGVVIGAGCTTRSYVTGGVTGAAIGGVVIASAVDTCDGDEDCDGNPVLASMLIGVMGGLLITLFETEAASSRRAAAQKAGPPPAPPQPTLSETPSAVPDPRRSASNP